MHKEGSACSARRSSRRGCAAAAAAARPAGLFWHQSGGAGARRLTAVCLLHPCVCLRRHGFMYEAKPQYDGSSNIMLHYTLGRFAWELG